MADFGKYFRAYMYMQDILKNDFTYNYITEGLKDGDKGVDKLDGKTNEKVIDILAKFNAFQIWAKNEISKI